MKVYQDNQTFEVECTCGTRCQVTLNERAEVSSIEEDSFIQAEEDHGWGPTGECPPCLAASRADSDAFNSRSRRAFA